VTLAEMIKRGDLLVAVCEASDRGIRVKNLAGVVDELSAITVEMQQIAGTSGHDYHAVRAMPGAQVGQRFGAAG